MTQPQATELVPEWTLGDRLRKAREVAGLQAIQLADELGIHRQSVGNYESGKTTPRRLVLEAWARRTGVSLGWLTTGANVEAATPAATLVGAGARSSTDRASDYGSQSGRFCSPFRRPSRGRRRDDFRPDVIHLRAVS